jgi:tetratricopeptide (TPR) repeat protein
MKPVVVLGAIGAAAFAAALVAVAVLVDPREGAAPRPEREGTQVAAAPKNASPRSDSVAPMLADAERLLNRGGTPAARDLYARARAQYRRDNNAAGEAAATFGLGKLEHFNGQSQAARTAFTEALALYARADDAAGMARVEVAVCAHEKDTIPGPPAMQHYYAARAHWARVPEPKSDPHVLLNLDRAAQMPAGEARARAVIDQADKIFHNIGDTGGEGDAAMVLAALEMNLGNPRAAQAAFGWARFRYADAGLRAQELNAVLSVASAEILQGYNIDAEVQLAAAVTLARGDGTSMARVAVVRGDLERLQGRLIEARDHYEHAALILGATDSVEEATALLKAGRMHLGMGETAAAWPVLEAAAAVGERRGAAAVRAAARLELGLLALRNGDLGAARELLTASAAELRAARDAVSAGRAHLALGETALRQNDAAAADAAFTLAAVLFAKIPYGLVLAELGKGDAARAAGNAAAARAAYGRAVDLRQAIPAAITEAARLLGLPPVESLYYVAPGEEPESGNPPDPAIVKLAEEIRARNRASFPGMQIEARRLLEATDARLDAAASFAREQN